MIAALVATVASKEENCDPSKLHFKIYHDAKCTKFDKELTEKFGTPAKEDYHYFKSSDCQNSPGEKWGWTLQCSAVAMHQMVWDNQKCNGKPLADMKYKWGSCQQSPETDKLWFRPTTEQKF